ncbi:hypothetical protein JCM19235_2126 [Vibrio maritimus]|uniref:Uncharacterized protein n=1 Tax=Vibrio maritimus TaxID=990268 RepID=A0A090RVU1_9VIBR|nr:hypothetical protein JCM19235_2126 [Vibrio maritimus]
MYLKGARPHFYKPMVEAVKVTAGRATRTRMSFIAAFG